MIVEYLPGGDLLSFLLKSRQYRCQSPNNTAEGSFLTAEHLVTFAWQISLGMNHIAQHNVSQQSNNFGTDFLNFLNHLVVMVSGS